MDAQLIQAQEARERGLFVTAWQLLGAPTVATLRQWRDPEALLIASRILGFIGHPQLANRLLLRARQLAPGNAEIANDHAWLRRQHRGPVDCLDLLESLPANDETTLLRVHALADLNDLDRARKAWSTLSAEARADAPATMARIRIDWLSDQRDEALEQARALERTVPTYRPVVDHLLVWYADLGMRDDFRALLERADPRFEYPGLAAHAIQSAVHDDDPSAMARWTQRYRALNPLFGDHHAAWLAGMSAELHLRRGERREALACLQSAPSLHPHWSRVRDHLQSRPEAPPATRLKVRAVRQRFLTCAPATLASLLDYLGDPVSERTIADEICFGGTQSVRQRRFLRDRGFTTIDFRATEQAAHALLAAGIPFAIATQDFENGHLQAVIGHDPASNLYCVREPGSGYDLDVPWGYFRAEGMASGPRATVLCPRGREDEVRAMELPEATAYEHYGDFDEAIDAGDRDAAERALAAIPDDAARIRALAEWSLAAFDGDDARILAAIDRLLAMFPTDAWLHWCRLSASRQLESHAHRESALRRATLHCAHPNFLVSLARFQMQDTRTLDSAARLLQRAKKLRPVSALQFAAEGALADARRQRTRAAWLARLASLQAPANEDYAWRYFEAALNADLRDEALEWLLQRDRDARAMTRDPALTRVSALERLQRHAEAESLLDELVAAHPGDAAVVLRWIGDRVGTAANQEAIERLQPFRSHPVGARHLAFALVFAGRPEEALQLLHERLAMEPLALDLHRRIATLLADREGLAAAQAWLESAVARYPHHRGLIQLASQYLGRDRPAAAIRLLEQAVERHPDDAWSWRELGFLCLGQARLADAERASRGALAVDPHSPGTHNLLADVAIARHDREAAMAHWWQTIACGGAQEYAQARLLAHSATEQRAAVMIRIFEGLGQNAEDEEALLPWLSEARRFLPDAAILERWHGCRDRFGDSWQWHAGLVRLLADTDPDLALVEAARFTAAVPKLPVAWLTRARAERRVDRELALASVAQAIGLSPEWADALTFKASLLAELGRPEEGHALLVDACRRHPRDTQLLAHAAASAIQLRHFREAIELLERSLTIDEDHDWGWNRLEELDAGRAEHLALLWTNRRPGSFAPWHRLAYICADRNPARALIALERALAIEPESVRAIDLKAYILAEIGRAPEAAALLDGFDPDGRHPLLVARRVRLMWRERRTAEAMALLDATLRDRPGDSMLHALRADLATDYAYRPQARESIAFLRRQDPRDPTWARRHAFLLSAEGMTDEARAAFETVLELDPDDIASWKALIEADLTARHLDAADARITRARGFSRDPWLDALALESALRRKSPDAIDAALEAAMRNPDFREFHAERVETRIGEDWSFVVTRILKLLREPTQSTAFAGSLCRHAFVACYNHLENILDRMASPPLFASDEALAVAMLARLGESPDNGAFLESMLQRHQSVFDTCAPLRWQLSYGFAQADRHAPLCRLFANWRTIEGMPGWVSLNLARALVARGRRAEALSVRRSSIRTDATFRGLHAAYAWLDAQLLGESPEPDWLELARFDAGAEGDHGTRAKRAMLFIDAWCSQDPRAGLKMLYRHAFDEPLTRGYRRPVARVLRARLSSPVARASWWMLESRHVRRIVLGPPRPI